MGGYAVSGILPDGMLDDLASGTNIAILGPTMSGKRELAIRLLAAGYEDGDGILCVTTENANRVSTEIERHVSSLKREQIGIINCSGSAAQTIITDMTEQVSSPGDLTGISIGTAKLFKQFHSLGISDIRYGLISISTLLQYLPEDRVFKFIHIYTNRVEETDGFGIYTLNDDAHDPQVVNTISSQFDGLIQCRETDSGTVEVRVRGFSQGSTAWAPLE